MDAARALQIKQQLSKLNGTELENVAATALAQCEDTDCRNVVLKEALHRASALVPQHVGEGGRLALQVGAAASVGAARGLFGDLYGRLAAAIPAAAGLALGLMSRDAESKAAGFSVVGGASSGFAAVEARDLFDILRAKLSAKVTTSKPQVQPPAGQ